MHPTPMYNNTDKGDDAVQKNNDDDDSDKIDDVMQENSMQVTV